MLVLQTGYQNVSDQTFIDIIESPNSVSSDWWNAVRRFKRNIDHLVHLLFSATMSSSRLSFVLANISRAQFPHIILFQKTSSDLGRALPETENWK